MHSLSDCRSPNGKHAVCNPISACCARSPSRSGGSKSLFYRSPIDALVHLVVWSGLRRHVPIWLAVSTLAHLRVTVIPQGRSTCRGYVWGLRICPDVFEYLPDVGTVRDERNQAHLPTTKRAHQRENLIDAGEQNRPQVVRWALGRHRLALGRSISSRGVSVNSSALTPRLSLLGSLFCLAQWSTSSLPALRSRSRAAQSCAWMQTPASTEKPLCAYASISLASKLCSSPRPTKACRIRLRKEACT